MSAGTPAAMRRAIAKLQADLRELGELSEDISMDYALRPSAPGADTTAAFIPALREQWNNPARGTEDYHDESKRMLAARWPMLYRLIDQQVGS